MKLNSSQPDDITWVNGHRLRLGVRIIFCTRRVVQDQMGTQRGDGVSVCGDFQGWSWRWSCSPGQVGAEPSRGPFCCVVMTGRPLHYNIMEVGACLAFNSGVFWCVLNYKSLTTFSFFLSPSFRYSLIEGSMRPAVSV